MRSVVGQFENYAKLNKKLPAETAVQLGELVEAAKLSDSIMANIQVKVSPTSRRCWSRPNPPSGWRWRTR